LDFCYVIEGSKSIPMKVFLNNYYDQKFCGVVNIPNARDMYALYYDDEAHRCFHPLLSEKSKVERKEYLLSKGRAFGFGFKGITKKGEGANVAESNQLRLSSIPKVDQLGHEVKPIAIFTYNKDGYSSHCKDYKEYQEWLENRNETRYVETKEHGQRIDGKNMMHCVRLMQMAREIAEGKGINVRRSNANELISIRKGEVDLQTLINNVESEIVEIDNLFAASNLPDKVESDLINEILILIRKNIYNI
jgi:hypothetical protein